MSLETFLDDATCGCVPCEVDLTLSKWKTYCEDASYSGKRCGWHRVIVGKRGCITPDADDSIFVQATRIPVSVFNELDEQHENILAHVGSKFATDVQFSAPVGELDKWAKIIGAKRK